MKNLSSNRDLYDFLINLASELRDRGAVGLSETISSACAHASSLSTEFLGESRLALRHVLEDRVTLTPAQISEVSAALEQLDRALDRR